MVTSMAEPQEELKSFHELLARLESGELKMLSSHGEDVTQSEVSAFKRHISFVDAVLVYLKSKAEGASGPKGPN
jgi:predicted nucleic acid-binding protein